MSIPITTNKLVAVSTNKLRLNSIGENLYSTPNNYQEIKSNIEECGLIQPILVNANDFQVISGNLRVKIALELGLKEVPVIFYDLTPAEIEMIFISSNFQREKSILDKYRELQLINKLFNLVKGSRTDLNPQLKEEKIRKDELKKGLSTYEVNSFNRINKLAQVQYGDKFQEIVERELSILQEKNQSLNVLVKNLEKQSNPKKDKSTRTISKAQVIQQLKKVLNQLPVEQHKEVLESLLQQYDFQMVG